ncbi:MAG: hypothetical protein FXF54_04825 [Kosmotoga sp.]|nr:MAG: hypothetical protein FXF54_04825 [Kosmotoga sp.]
MRWNCAKACEDCS